MKNLETWVFEVFTEENGKIEDQYSGYDELLALEILKANTCELEKKIKQGKAKVYLVCK